MNSPIRYTGSVTVKVKGRPPIKTKNAGTSAFFTSLYNILAQVVTTNNQEVFSSFLPSYISIVIDVKQGSSNLTTAYLDTQQRHAFSALPCSRLLLASMPIYSKEVTDNSVNFSCLLNNSNIKLRPDSGAEGHILLLDGKQENILAYSKFALDDISTVVNNSWGQATITWNMSFNNTQDK